MTDTGKWVWYGLAHEPIRLKSAARGKGKPQKTSQ